MSKPSGIALLIGNMKADKSGQDPIAKQSKLREALDKLSGDKSPDESEEVSSEEQYRTAMQDFIDAVRHDKVSLAMEAFKDVMKLCPEEEGEEGKDDGGDLVDDHQGYALDDTH